MSDAKKVKVVLDIGGTVEETLKSSFNLVTGNLLKIGEVADKAIRGKFKRALDEAKKSNDALARGLATSGLNVYNRIGSVFSTAARGIGVVSAEAGLAIHKLHGFVEAYDEYVMSVYKGRAKLGMNSENFAGLKFAAGGDFEKVETGFSMFLSNLRNGNKNTIKYLSQIGVEAKSLKGKSPTEVLSTVMDAFANYKGNRAGLPRLLGFGRGGNDLTAFLEKGGGFLKSQTSMANAMGLVPTDDDIAKAKSLALHEKAIRGELQGLNLAIGHAAEGPFARLAEVIDKLLQKRGPQIVEWISKFGEKIEEHIPSVETLDGWIDRASNCFERWGKNIGGVVNSIGGWKVVVGAVLAMPFLPFIASLGSLAAAFVQLGVAVAAAEVPLWPFIAAGAAIAAGGYLVWKNWDKVKEAFSLLAPEIADLSKAFDSLKQAMQPIWDIAAPALASFGKLMGSVFVGWLKFEIEMYAKAFDLLAKSINAVVNAGSQLKGIWNKTSLPAGGLDPSNFMAGAQPKKTIAPTMNNTIHVHAAPGMDAHQVAKLVMDRLNGTQYALANGALYDV